MIPFMRRFSKIKIGFIALAIGYLMGCWCQKYQYLFKSFIPNSAIHQPHVLKVKIQAERLPQHVAIMMDGNGRWAAQQGKPRVFGHLNALQSVEEAITACMELGIPYLTLYAFSTENWQRPQEEIDTLMNLLRTNIRDKLTELIKNDIQLQVIGDMSQLPLDCRTELVNAIQATRNNKGLHLIIAMSYSGRWDIVQATQALVVDAIKDQVKVSDIDASLFQKYLSTHNIPDPDLLIRTGGDMRISNFLLWQLAYTELLILKKYWPDFRKVDFYQAIIIYQQRDRRFGKVASKF
jgi:undecaprenyl diphosphate synthase